MEKFNSQLALNHQDKMDFFDRLAVAHKYRALGTPGLAIGSVSKAKVLIANTTPYLHNGIFKSKTTAEVAFTATTHDIPADADEVQEAIYVVLLAADGTPSIKMGAIASGSGAALLPELSATDGTPIGYVRVAVAAGATSFDASTDELDEAHITDTYVNLGFVCPMFGATQ